MLETWSTGRANHSVMTSMGWSGVIVRERGGQLGVGLSLREERLGLGLERLHGVNAGSEAGRRLLERSQPHNSVGQLCGVSTLLPIHAPPGIDDLPRSLSVVVDGGLGVGGRLVGEQLGAKEPGLDAHRANAK